MPIEKIYRLCWLFISCLFFLLPRLAFAQPVADDMEDTAHDGSILTLYLKATGDNLTYQITSQPTKGIIRSFDDTSGLVSYSFNSCETGDDTFKFIVKDDQEIESNEATVTIHINNRPKAKDMEFSIMAGKTHSGYLEYENLDDDDLTFTIVIKGIRGMAEMVDKNTGEFIYSVDADYRGTDKFSFQISDGFLISNTANTTVTVTPNTDEPSTSPGCSIFAPDNANRFTAWICTFIFIGLILKLRFRRL